jgi:hypothetical protein
MSISTLIKNGLYDDDILIICDNEIKNIININYPKLKFMIVDKVVPNLSSGNKLRIFEYTSISDYTNILYLDSDILIVNNINIIFEKFKDIKDVFVGSSENIGDYIVGVYWAGPLLDNSEKIKYENIRSFNAGCFLFYNTADNLKILNDSYYSYINGVKFIVYEQPYLNYYLLINNKYCHDLQKYITHNGCNDDIDLNKVIIHYSGGPGNFEYKYLKMKKDYDNNRK